MKKRRQINLNNEGRKVQLTPPAPVVPPKPVVIQKVDVTKPKLSQVKPAVDLQATIEAAWKQKAAGSQDVPALGTEISPAAAAIGAISEAAYNDMVAKFNHTVVKQLAKTAGFKTPPKVHWDDTPKDEFHAFVAPGVTKVVPLVNDDTSKKKWPEILIAPMSLGEALVFSGPGGASIGIVRSANMHRVNVAGVSSFIHEVCVSDDTPAIAWTYLNKVQILRFGPIVSNPTPETKLG